MSTICDRKVTVKVLPTGHRKPMTYRFIDARPNGRAARWLQNHYPVVAAVSDTAATMRGAGGTVEVTGCRISDLYPYVTAPRPQELFPNPSPLIEPASSDPHLRKPKPRRRGKK